MAQLSKGCLLVTLNLHWKLGSYCQLYRPSGIGGIQSKARKKEFKVNPSKRPPTSSFSFTAAELPKPPPEVDTFVRIRRDPFVTASVPPNALKPSMNPPAATSVPNPPPAKSEVQVEVVNEERGKPRGGKGVKRGAKYHFFSL